MIDELEKFKKNKNWSVYLKVEYDGGRGIVGWLYFCLNEIKHFWVGVLWNSDEGVDKLKFTFAGVYVHCGNSNSAAA